LYRELHKLFIFNDSLSVILQNQLPPTGLNTHIHGQTTDM